MEILSKQYVIDKPEIITADYIENIIYKSGYEPIRWAIVKSDNNKLTIEAVIIDTVN